MAIEAENPTLKGVLAKGLQPPGARQGDGRRADQSDLRHRARIAKVPRRATCSAASMSIFSAASPGPKASAAASSTRPVPWSACWSKCWSRFRSARGVEGRVYDPCCGSGGMFVQAERFLEAHGGRIGELAIYGQESNYTTWRLAKMNLAVRGIDASGIAWNNEGSFHKDEWRTRDLISSWPIRRSMSPTGAANACARMRAGNTACRRSATPTMPGCSTSSITLRRMERRAWCLPMARCPPAKAART